MNIYFNNKREYKVYRIEKSIFRGMSIMIVKGELETIPYTIYVYITKCGQYKIVQGREDIKLNDSKLREAVVIAKQNDGKARQKILSNDQLLELNFDLKHILNNWKHKKFDNCLNKWIIELTETKQLKWI